MALNEGYHAALLLGAGLAALAAVLVATQLRAPAASDTPPLSADGDVVEIEGGELVVAGR